MRTLIFGNSGSGKSTLAKTPTRDNAWSYAAHRRIFDAHTGSKSEHIIPPTAS